MPPLIIDNHNYIQQINERLDRLQIPRPFRDPQTTHQASLKNPGCKPRIATYGSLSFAPPAEQTIDLIPRNLWSRLITEGKGTFLSDLCRPKLPPHDQGSTNYCWAHGAAYPIETAILFATNNPLTLSAESIAVPLTGGRNRGGTPEEALTRLVTHGACAQTFWPPNDRDITHALPGWQQDALLHRLCKFVDVLGFPYQITLALKRIPVILPLNWWRHEVAQLDPIQLDTDTYGLGCMNSWGPDYANEGYFILAEEKAEAEDGAFGVLWTKLP